MKNSIETYFILKDFFFAQAAMGKCLKGESYMKALAEIYGRADDADKLYMAAMSETEIESAADYRQACRVDQYMETMAGDDMFPFEDEDEDEDQSARDAEDGEENPEEDLESLGITEEDLIDIKGKAYELAEKYGIEAGRKDTWMEIRERLESPAAAYLVPVMRMKGIEECALYVSYDRDGNRRCDEKRYLMPGVKLLERAAMWNDPVSCMALIFFDYVYTWEGPSSNSWDHLTDKDLWVSVLCALAKDTAFSSMAEAYAPSRHEDWDLAEECGVLADLFRLNASYKPDVVDEAAEDVLYAKNMSLADRRKILYDSVSRRSALTGLPVSSSEEPEPLYLSFLPEDVPFGRVSEAEMIRRAVNAYAEYMDEEGSRPLCLVTDSRYLREKYERFFTEEYLRWGDAATDVIRLSACTEADVDEVSSNVFLRSYDPSRPNVRIIEMCGSMEPAVKRHAVKFISTEGRMAYFLKDRQVTADITHIMSIVFTDSSGKEFAENYCDVLDLEPITEFKEKDLALKDLLEKAGWYGSTAAEAYGKLLSMDTDRAAEVLQRAAGKARAHGEHEISMKDIEEVSRGRESEYFGLRRRVL
ncbi:MAG: hypothetical protein LUE27_06095 [Clostridia bacterium]|nr:hypothetical protein [Clostridia bacterium]